jgi:hypothetical protein
MRLAWHVARMGERRGAYTVLVGNPEDKRPLGRPRWEDNIKMDRKEIVWAAWTGLIWLRTGATTMSRLSSHRTDLVIRSFYQRYVLLQCNCVCHKNA